MPETISPPPTSKETASYRSQHASPHVRHERAVMHVGIANSRWRGKRFRHSRRMRNPQFYVSGKRPVVMTWASVYLIRVYFWKKINRALFLKNRAYHQLVYSWGFVINTLRQRNCRHFVDDIFIGIFLNENVWISLKFSLKFVPKVRFNNIPTLVQIMVRRRPGDKPALSEPMMVSVLTHICVTRPQWVLTGTVIVFKLIQLIPTLGFQMSWFNGIRCHGTRLTCSIVKIWFALTFIHNDLPNRHFCAICSRNNQDSTPDRLCAANYIHGVWRPLMLVTHFQKWYYWRRVRVVRKGVWVGHCHSYYKVR